MLKGIGATELIIVLVIVLVIFGAGRLPEIGSALGKSLRSFKRGVSEDEPEKSDKAKEEAAEKDRAKT